jgi:hypothetical protein
VTFFSGRGPNLAFRKLDQCVVELEDCLPSPLRRLTERGTAAALSVAGDAPAIIDRLAASLH